MIMLSSLVPEEIAHAIQSEDVKTIQSVKGIGAKTAQRVIVDLKDKMLKMNFSTENIFVQNNTNRFDALTALVSLGFDKKAAEKAIDKIAQGMDYRPPSMMTLEEYLEYDRQQSIRDNWKDKIDQQTKDSQPFALPIKINDKLFKSFFGSDEITIRPQGTVEIGLGVNSSRYDNPLLPVKQRRITRFDFNQNINFSVVGQIGTRMKLGMKYNTQASFEFDNQTKLEYNGDEDQIIQSIALGNVSLDLPTTLIPSSKTLVNGIADFRSIRFMRIFMKDFDEEVLLRFAKLELVRGEWRKFQQDLSQPGENIVTDPNLTSFDIGAVNIQENSDRTPIKYVIPPGIQREIDPSQQIQRQMNEQSLTLEVCGLQDGDARAAYKNVTFDVRGYKKMKMFVHAESMVDQIPLNNEDLTVFIRLGTDFTENYYEYEVPLTITQFGASLDTDIWPEENNIEIVFDDLINLKKQRNNLIESGSSRFDSGFGAPMGGFVFGKQRYNIAGKDTGFDFARTAAENGWLVQNENINRQYTNTHVQNLTIRAGLEPMKDLTIELTANRTYGNNSTEFFRWNTATGTYE
ncbi:hypothetical protein ANCCEY_15090, partial [Ancylostoma ceylanicum]